MKTFSVALVIFSCFSVSRGSPINGPIEHVDGRPLSPAPLAQVFHDLQSPSNSADKKQIPMGLEDDQNIAKSGSAATPINPSEYDHLPEVENLVSPLDKITESSKALWHNLLKFLNGEEDMDAGVIWQRKVHRLRRGTFFSRFYRVVDRPQLTTFTTSMPGFEIEQPTPADDLAIQTAHAMDTNTELPNPQPLEKFFAEPDPADLPPLPIFTHSVPTPSPAAASPEPELLSSTPPDGCQIHTYIYASPLDPFAARPLLGVAFVGALFLCAYSTVQLLHSCFCARRIRLTGTEAPIMVTPYQVPTDGYPGTPGYDGYYADDVEDGIIIISDDEGFSALSQAEEGRLSRDPSPRAPDEKMT